MIPRQTGTGADPRVAVLALRDEVGKVVVGQEGILSGLVAALLVRGHVLLEGVPGVAKTLLVKAVSAALDLDFKRLQFTPDLMPSDVIGQLIFESATGSFRFREGPVFTNVLLADEINRTPPKTQAALLESMEERQVTMEGESRPLPEPFVVVATQNPVEYEGTYPLPEAQLDRFLFKLIVGYPNAEQESEILAAPRPWSGPARHRGRGCDCCRDRGRSRGRGASRSRRSRSSRPCSTTSSPSHARPATHRRSASACLRAARRCCSTRRRPGRGLRAGASSRLTR